MTNLRKGDGEGEFVILSGARGAKSKNLKRGRDFSTALEMTNLRKGDRTGGKCGAKNRVGKNSGG